MTDQIFNNRFRQIILFLLILLIAVLLIAELTIFIPGLLGSITLYILTRSLFLRLIYKNKWKKGITAILFILVSLICISIPIYFSIELLAPKLKMITNEQDKLIQGVAIIIKKIETFTEFPILTNGNASSIAEKAASYVPQLLNSTALLLTNILMMFFLYYFMLVGGDKMEKYLSHIIPLKKENIHLLAVETQHTIRANALGIPLICVVQGIFAALGYWIFKVDDWGMWGFFTGLFAFFPLVGTMIIWVPIVAYMYANGIEWPATGLALYSFLVTGNVDYIARITLMKKIGDVHPLITILGVIVGLNLFGFVGLIFGPLLISYLIVLIKIYINEFVVVQKDDASIP